MDFGRSLSLNDPEPPFRPGLRVPYTLDLELDGAVRPAVTLHRGFTSNSPSKRAAELSFLPEFCLSRSSNRQRF